MNAYAVGVNDLDELGYARSIKELLVLGGGRTPAQIDLDSVVQLQGSRNVKTRDDLINGRSASGMYVFTRTFYPKPLLHCFAKLFDLKKLTWF